MDEGLKMKDQDLVPTHSGSLLGPEALRLALGGGGLGKVAS